MLFRSVMFLAVLAVGGAVLAWVLRQAAKASAATPGQAREEA